MTYPRHFIMKDNAHYITAHSEKNFMSNFIFYRKDVYGARRYLCMTHNGICGMKIEEEDMGPKM